MVNTIIQIRSVLLGVLLIGFSLGEKSSVMASDATLVTADAEVALSAQMAVQKMGVEMMKGNFAYAHQKMYPRWKSLLASRYGGMKKLEEGLALSLKKQAQIGMIVTRFTAKRPTTFFSVWKAKKRDKNGRVIKDARGHDVIVDHWLTFVPTVTQVKVMDKSKGGRLITLEEKSYTVVVSEKGTNDWYFLTGVKPTIQDLRSLFPLSLPAEEEDLHLPPSSARVIK